MNPANLTNLYQLFEDGSYTLLNTLSGCIPLAACDDNPDGTLIVIMAAITLLLAVAWLTAEIRRTMRSDDQPDNFIECRRTYTQHGLSDGTNPRHARYSGR